MFYIGGCESERIDKIDVIADRRQPILYAATLGRMWVYGGEARRNTGFAAALIFFKAPQAVYPCPGPSEAVVRPAPVVLPLAMAASRL